MGIDPVVPRLTRSDSGQLLAPHALDLLDDVRPVRCLVHRLAGRDKPQQITLSFGQRQDVGFVEIAHRMPFPLLLIIFFIEGWRRRTRSHFAGSGGIWILVPGGSTICCDGRSGPWPIVVTAIGVEPGDGSSFWRMDADDARQEDDVRR
jgi:hypothetical protein